jgi:hypothetical protein
MAGAQRPELGARFVLSLVELALSNRSARDGLLEDA